MINFYQLYNGELDNAEYDKLIDQLMKGRYSPELEDIEHIIKTDSWCSLCYALYYKGGRWPDGEPTVMKHPVYAYMYARDVIKARWVEAEPYIIMKSDFWSKYCEIFGI